MTKTRALLFMACCAVVPASAHGQVVATCSDPQGYSYYHHSGLLTKQQSGFEKDKISGGLTTLQRLDSGEFDVLIVDTRKQVISYRNDGGRIILLRKGSSDATFLVVFPGMVIEVYTFYVESDGTKRYDLLQSKGGDRQPIHKSSVLTGTCSHIDLDAAKATPKP